jgi:CRISPR-associated protein Csb3
VTQPKPSFTLEVDVMNPGQFFACCGLLELAHRLWSDAQGWFDASNRSFALFTDDSTAGIEHVLSKLRQCEISGLSEQERHEREQLEKECRELKRQGRQLSPDREERRKALGAQARGGVVRIEDPFFLVLDWWQTSDEQATPKTWAGLQELHKIARAAQDALAGLKDQTRALDYGCVLRMPHEYCRGKSEQKKPVEPFYFDARRFAHALDAGFSLDAQGAETIAHPAVELFSLIGLQRFRPTAGPLKWSFDYRTWSRPLNATVAAAVVSGAAPIPTRQGYRFQLRFRDDQKRYKAFGFAIPIGDDI